VQGRHEVHKPAQGPGVVAPAVQIPHQCRLPSHLLHSGSPDDRRPIERVRHHRPPHPLGVDPRAVKLSISRRVRLPGEVENRTLQGSGQVDHHVPIGALHTAFDT
jgi:hypothetical protein